MSERTVEDAMAHAAIIRQNGPRYDREESPHEFDVVLLADEILRLRLELNDAECVVITHRLPWHRRLFRSIERLLRKLK